MERDEERLQERVDEERLEKEMYMLVHSLNYIVLI